MEEANRREKSQGDNGNNGKIKSQVQKEENQVEKTICTTNRKKVFHPSFVWRKSSTFASK